MKINDNEKRGILFSVIFHIICCGLVGVFALSTYQALSHDPIYDVALVAGGGDAAPETVQSEPEKPQEEEEEVQPQKDDITEQRTVSVKKPSTERKSSTPPKYTAPGGTGSGSSPGSGGGSGGGTGQGVGPASDAIQGPAVPPRVTRSRMPSYPESARSQKITGTAVIRFLVGKDGGVENVSLARSSGNSALDQAALNAAGGFRFRPGLDGYGRPIRCYAYLPFAFRL